MTIPEVGFLAEVRLRDAFPSEAAFFTPWLARDDALEYLGQRIGLGRLTPVGTEVPIPGGRALDLLAELPDGRKVAIENQFGAGDHDHLTRGLAYAVALGANALVVVAEHHRDEFVEVANYLNRVADQAGEDGIAVFLVKARAVELGGHRAVDFDVQAGPNEWRRAVTATLSTYERQLERFWTRFIDETAVEHPLVAQLGPPRPSNALGIRMMPGHSHWTYLSASKRQVYVYLYLDNGGIEATNVLFDRLAEHTDEIERRYGGPLTWERREDRYASVVHTEKLPISYLDEHLSGAQLLELASMFERFHAACSPALEAAVADAAIPG